MIAADSSTIVAFFHGDEGGDVAALRLRLQRSEVILPPVVATELLSNWNLTLTQQHLIESLPLLPIMDGYWFRAGRLRAVTLQKKRKARIADCLIAQSCIDHDIPLLTRDKDFTAFAKHCGLKLHKAG